MRVLHLPTDTGGQAYSLSWAERRMGLDSSVLVAVAGNFKYPAHRVLAQHAPRGLAAKLALKLRLAAEFLRVRSKYDVFHFNFGASLINLPRLGLPLLELPFYPKRARLVFTYNGCDARLMGPTRELTETSACMHPDCGGGICADGRMDQRRRKSLARMDRFACAIFALNPDLLRFLPARAQFLPYAAPLWLGLSAPPLREAAGPLRLVHAPTDRVVKGTGAVLEAVAQLQAEFGPHAVELDLVERLPHAEAVGRYVRADIVVDQLRVGWYGGLAVEAMLLGKPVVAYISKDDLRFLPPDMAAQCLEALIPATEATLADVLRPYVENRAQLAARREAALEYVWRWHDPAVVAAQVRAAYDS